MITCAFVSYFEMDCKTRSLCVMIVTIYLVHGITEAQVPSGYRLNVIPDCGSDGVEDAYIVIINDLGYINATADCVNGIFPFNETKSTKLHLPVSYSQVTDKCGFKRADNKTFYFIHVAISFGEPGREVTDSYLTHTVTCSFAPRSDNYTLNHGVVDWIMAPEELLNLEGGTSAEVISVKLTDVLGNDITGKNISLGKKIRIVVEAKNLTGIIGISPVSCDVIANRTTYNFLKAGCGDGLIFPKTSGFTNSGLVSRSPYFKFFGIEREELFRVECTVVVCQTKCAENSCRNERFRRWLDEGQDKSLLVKIRST